MNLLMPRLVYCIQYKVIFRSYLPVLVCGLLRYLRKSWICPCPWRLYKWKRPKPPMCLEVGRTTSSRMDDRHHINDDSRKQDEQQEQEIIDSHRIDD